LKEAALMRSQIFFKDVKNAAVIVAHPDDETLWSGGTILSHPQIDWTILTITRKSDCDRAPKFYNACTNLNAKGFMADLDDGPQQKPLSISEIQSSILSILPKNYFDLIITHNIKGEYTRHLRHEEVSQAVGELIKTGKIKCTKFLNFAYEDGEKKHLPRPLIESDLIFNLPLSIWDKKKDIIKNAYGFSPDCFEAKVCSNLEAYIIPETGK
jgi:LmbE family N-acetylglucosaminyl deacetylase